MITIRSTADGLRNRSGQAMIETAIGLTVFVFIVAALVSLADLFIGDIDMLALARSATGSSALQASGGEAHGNGHEISVRAHPKVEDYGEYPIPESGQDPYQYPCGILANSHLPSWRDDTATPFVALPPTAQVRNFPIDVSLMGSETLFPKGITLNEKVYLPPLGKEGLR